MLPLTGLMTALFVGWVLPEAVTREELKVLNKSHLYHGWMIMLKYGVTLVMGIVFYNLVF